MSADNSWVRNDKGAFFKTSVTNFKIILTIVILMSGSIVAVAVHDIGAGATMYQAEGILMDFGNYNTYWTDVDFKEETDPLELLEKASDKANFSYEVSDSKLVSVTKMNQGTGGPVTYSNNDTSSWGLWYIETGGTEFVHSDSYDIKASDYTVTVWAYTKGSAEPAVAVDATGVCVYGYSSPKSMVTLSPVSTEIVGAIKATSLIVGTDMYSDYPDLITEGRNNGTIKIVGTYTGPNYEAIMSLSPQMVICDGSQLSHEKMATSLRSSGVNAVVLYSGDDIQTILKNIFIVGAAMEYEQRAAVVVNELTSTMKSIKKSMSDISGTVMVTLGGDASPCVAGNNTFINSILQEIGAKNVFSDRSGWLTAISEYISQRNPSYIIVLDYGSYIASEYDQFKSSLSGEWKSTDAYKNNHIYLLCENLGNMSERSGPRFMQLFEIFARILDPSAFGNSTIPLAIGNEYLSYLIITKDLGYNN